MTRQEDRTRRVGRRSVFSLSGGAVTRTAVLGGLLAGFLGLRRSRSMPAGARGGLGMVRPPGSRDEKEFLSLCIRCTRCADSCEVLCIELFGPEAGSLQGTPFLIPGERGCNLCLRCGETCPTGAINPLVEKEEAKMGVAVVDVRLCVSHNGTGICGACHTICPLRNRAITQNFRNAPVIHDEKCTGCGLCEETCIVRDRRAIRVATDRLWPSAKKESSS